MAVQKTYSSQKEIAEIWKLFRDTDRRMKETDQKMQDTDRRLKKLDELFTSQWGKLMEALVKGDLIKLLRKKGIEVEATLTNLEGEYKGQKTEVDIVADNGKEAVVVEVKTTLKVGHIDHFIKKLKNFTKWRKEYKNKTVYGAVAYLKADEGADAYSEKNGLFVIRATGSSASITNAKNFKPKAFS